MGRSVSSPSDAIVAYYDVTEHGHAWDDENSCVNYDDYCEFQAEDDWNYFKEWMVEKVTELFPSMTPCEEWVDHELAIAENQLAYFGVSEYCGCASVWIVSKEDCYGNINPLAEAWVQKINKKFHANFGEINRIGVMSNGEAVYEKKVA